MNGFALVNDISDGNVYRLFVFFGNIWYTKLHYRHIIVNMHL